MKQKEHTAVSIQKPWNRSHMDKIHCALFGSWIGLKLVLNWVSNPTNFHSVSKISSFVVSQMTKSCRVRKWWFNFHLKVNYPFNCCLWLAQLGIFKLINQSVIPLINSTKHGCFSTKKRTLLLCFDWYSEAALMQFILWILNTCILDFCNAQYPAHELSVLPQCWVWKCSPPWDIIGYI